jgi:hypothetical protein
MRRGYNKRMPKLAFAWLLLAAITLLAVACPHASDESRGSSTRDALASSAPIPLDSPLCKYETLKLGMSEFDLAQVYNAPEGKGQGFTRVLQRYDPVSIHTIKFDAAAGQPTRVMLLEFYRDQLCRIVDRRDALSGKQTAAWLAECKQRYGEPTAQPVPGAQWSWGAKDSVLLTFTQDNASENSMSANVVLAHQPTLDTAQNALVEWEKEHPEQPPANKQQAAK